MKKLLVGVIILLLVWWCFEFVLMSGNPFKVYEYRKQAQIYLDNKYESKMIIDNGYMFLWSGGFSGKAHRKDYDDFTFSITVYKEEEEYIIRDNYFESKFKYELELKADEFFDNILGYYGGFMYIHLSLTNSKLDEMNLDEDYTINDIADELNYNYSLVVHIYKTFEESDVEEIYIVFNKLKDYIAPDDLEIVWEDLRVYIKEEHFEEIDTLEEFKELFVQE